MFLKVSESCRTLKSTNLILWLILRQRCPLLCLPLFVILTFLRPLRQNLFPLQHISSFVGEIVGETRFACCAERLLCTFRLRFFRFPIQKASWQLLSVSMAFTLYTNSSRLFFKAGTWLVRLVSWRIWSKKQCGKTRSIKNKPLRSRLETSPCIP